MSEEKRLIDANALASRIWNEAECYKGTDGFVWVRRGKIGLLLDEAPVVDAVEVVRCRECKYWGDEAGELQRSDGVLFARCKVHNYLLDGRHTGWCPTENDFCSYGERKEGAD